MISPGAIVMCRQTSDVAWIAERLDFDGRWKVTSKGIDARGRAVYFGRVAGEGDLTVVTPAPVYQAGETVERNGLNCTVARDLGDAVELIVPASRRPLRGGGALSIPGGNAVTLSKADLALESLT